jgi:uncharacterized membrane protein YeiH
MTRDPEILSKIARLSEEHEMDAVAVIALLAITALAGGDMHSLVFWSNAAGNLKANHDAS